MLGEEASVASMRIVEEFLKIMREIIKNNKKNQKNPKNQIGENDLNELTKSGEDMVAIQEELTEDELDKFRELADNMGILYSVVENPLEDGKNIIFVKRTDLEKAEICFKKIFANKVIENAKKEAKEKGVSEEDVEKAVELFTAEENHILNQKGITFEDALDHLTERDYARDKDYFLFDRNNPDRYIKMHSNRELDHKGREYTKTTYTTYYKDKEVLTCNDGRFEGREKNFWYKLKEKMKSQTTKDGEEIPAFSDNVFILNSKEDLIKFQDVYKKQLGYIKDNQGKRLSKDEINNLKNNLSDDKITKDVPKEILMKLENSINEIEKIQNDIEMKKIQCFDLYESKEEFETKENRRERLEKLNILSDEIKQAEMQLTKEYMNKDNSISEIEDIIGRQLEKEVYEVYKGEVVEENLIEKEDVPPTKNILYITAPEEYIKDIATYAKEQGINVAVMEDPNHPGKKIYTWSKAEETHQDIDSFLKSQGVSSISIMQDPDNPNKFIFVVTRENYDEFKLLVDKTLENRAFEKMKNTTDFSLTEYNAFMNKYGEKVIENMNSKDKELGSNTVDSMINQVSQRYALQNQEIYICDEKKPYNFIKAENIVSENGKIDNLYTISIDGKEEKTNDIIKAKKAFNKEVQCKVLPNKKQYNNFKESQMNKNVNKIIKLEHNMMEH